MHHNPRNLTEILCLCWIVLVYFEISCWSGVSFACETHFPCLTWVSFFNYSQNFSLFDATCFSFVRLSTASLPCCLLPAAGCDWLKSLEVNSTSPKRRLESVQAFFCRRCLDLPALTAWFALQAQHFCQMYRPDVRLGELQACVGRATLQRKQAEAVMLTQ